MYFGLKIVAKRFIYCGRKNVNFFEDYKSDYVSMSNVKKEEYFFHCIFEIFYDQFFS